jgi:Ca2+-binding RTX toxin-like protein
MGAAGGDLIYGGGGVDHIEGHDGDDLIHGGDGADYVAAGNGDDTVSGEAGNDVLIGGAGADQFSFSTGDGADNVTDFADGTDGLFLDGRVNAGNIGTYLTEVNGNATFDFGGGDVITLTGVSQTNITMADILG